MISIKLKESKIPRYEGKSNDDLKRYIDRYTKDILENYNFTEVNDRLENKIHNEINEFLNYIKSYEPSLNSYKINTELDFYLDYYKRKIWYLNCDIDIDTSF